MKNKIQILSAIIAMFSILCWLQSCDSTDFSNDAESLVNNDNADLEESEDSDDLEEVEVQEAKKLTADEIQAEVDKIFANPTILDGKKVKVCMAYVGVYNSIEKHYCDHALFNVFFNGSTTANSKQLNLNNGACRDVTLISSKKTLTIGDACTAAKKKEMKTLFGQEFAELHLKENNNHVPGILYENAKWKDGAVDIKVACALDKNTCKHKGALISLSMISEVKLSDGTKKYISAERVTLPTDNDKVSMKSYKLKEDFESEILDNKPEFDDYCGIIKK